MGIRFLFKHFSNRIEKTRVLITASFTYDGSVSALEKASLMIVVGAIKSLFIFF